MRQTAPDLSDADFECLRSALLWLDFGDRDTRSLVINSLARSQRGQDAILEWLGRSPDFDLTAYFSAARNIAAERCFPNAVLDAATDRGWVYGGPILDFRKLNSELAALVREARRRDEPFGFLSSDELDNPSEPLWRVKNIFPLMGVTAIYGAPGGGKTFLSLDLAWKLALGIRWFERRVVQSYVYYFALEGQRGIIRRLQALALESGEERPPHLRLGTTFDLMNQQFIEQFIAVCEPQPVIIIDTMSQAASGADDNSPSDMGQIVHSAQTLAERIGALVILVAHTGKDEGRGIRGHTKLTAALDASIFVHESRGQKEWIVAKCRDAETGVSFGFELVEVEIGLDTEGEMQRSCTVKPIDGPIRRTLSRFGTKSSLSFNVAAKPSRQFPRPSPRASDGRRRCGV